MVATLLSRSFSYPRRALASTDPPAPAAMDSAMALAVTETAGA